MRNEGYIKYSSTLSPEPPPPFESVASLDRVRTLLWDMGLIGMYPDGIGYGNCSIRYGAGFYISASATGHIRELGPEGYTRVAACYPQENRVEAYGSLPASSESMSHWVIYKAYSTVNCVLHVHNRPLFDRLLMGPTLRTPPDVPYGTPAMADALESAVLSASRGEGVCVMAGHDEGIIAYGDRPETVLILLQSL